MSKYDYEELEITISELMSIDIVRTSPIGGGNVDVGFEDEYETEIDIFSLDQISWSSLD